MTMLKIQLELGRNVTQDIVEDKLTKDKIVYSIECVGTGIYSIRLYNTPGDYVDTLKILGRVSLLTDMK